MSILGHVHPLIVITYSSIKQRQYIVGGRNDESPRKRVRLGPASDCETCERYKRRVDEYANEVNHDNLHCSYKYSDYHYYYLINAAGKGTEDEDR